MASAFLAQLSAGCLLVVAASMIRASGWKYLRLMAAVCLGTVALGGAMLLREPDWADDGLRRAGAWALGLAAVFTVAWLVANALQGAAIRGVQRIWPLAGGAACLTAAVLLGLRPDAGMPAGAGADAAVHPLAATVTTLLGAILLGVVTSGMLLGHRYLTDTEMPIAPLLRLGRFYVAAVAMRLAWVAAASSPVWAGSFQPRGDVQWFWLLLSVRAGLGLIGAAVFAWMTWDCIRRRATQSATAMFYLSMVFVFVGELAGQYMRRTWDLAM